VEAIDDYDHRYIPFVHSCILLLMGFLVLHISVVGGVGCVYMCGFVVNWVRLHLDLSVSLSICVFVYYFCVFCFVFCFMCFCS